MAATTGACGDSRTPLLPKCCGQESKPTNGKVCHDWMTSRDRCKARRHFSQARQVDGG
jgi:hypothetical protein